jgi:dTDP-4-amino-4,6-dideoxygalactose transaminase
VVRYDETEQCNFHYVVLEIDELRAGLTRDELQRVLWEENVLARRYFFPGCHRMEPYRSEVALPPSGFPVADKLAQQVLALPTGAALSERDCGRLCQLIRFVFDHGPQVREGLTKSSNTCTH